jgi:hypothetical protein
MGLRQTERAAVYAAGPIFYTGGRVLRNTSVTTLQGQLFNHDIPGLYSVTGLTIQSVEFRNHIGQVVGTPGNVVISQSVFEDNTFGDIVNLDSMVVNPFPGISATGGQITRSLFRNKLGRSGSDISFSNPNSLIIENNVFLSTHALTGSDLARTSCGCDGVIQLLGQQSTTVRHNSFRAGADFVNGYGPLVQFNGTGSVLVIGNIFSGGYYGIFQQGDGLLSERDNLFFGQNITVTAAGGTKIVPRLPISGSVTSFGGTVRADPLYLSESDLRLRAFSPAIDRVAEGLLTDFDGVARPAGAAFDLGAFEVAGGPLPTRTPTPTATPSIIFPTSTPMPTGFSAWVNTAAGAPQAGVDVVVIDGGAGDRIVASGRTSAQGFAFLGVSPGSYRVCAVIPPGSTNVLPALLDAQGRACYWYTIGAGQLIRADFVNSDVPVAAGFQALVRDEAGEVQTGVEVQAIDQANGDRVAASARTDAGGRAQLDVAPGSYRVCEVIPAGFTNVTPSIRDMEGRACYWFTLTGAALQDVQFVNRASGVVPTPTPTPAPGGQTVTFFARKYDDANANGRRDTGEPALQGWSITLDNQSTGQVRTLQTDANGNADFTDMPAGSYKICEVNQSGWRNTQPNQFDGVQPCYWITLPPNTQVTLPFGNTTRPTLSLAAAAQRINVEPLGAPQRDVVFVSTYLPVIVR